MIIVEVFVDTRMANFVSGFNDLGNIVGNFIDFAVCGVDGAHFLHFCLEELIKWAPEALSDEKHWHFWHLAFLHKDEYFGKLV